MCASHEAVTARRDASAALLTTCRVIFAEALRDAFPVDFDTPDDLKDFLDKL